MLTCIIVEDEYPAREELKYFLLRYKNITLKKEFENPIDALKYLQENKIDCVFLDINMPDLDGVNLGKILSQINPKIKIIFITAYRDYAVEAFEMKAFDYLLKPYSEARISEVLDNLVKNKSDNNITKPKNNINKVTVFSADEKMIVISLEEICFIEVIDKDTNVYTKNNIYSSKIKISRWEELLPANKFYRTHRSYIVNLDQIKEVEPWFNGTYILKMKDLSFKVPVSRNNIREFKELLIIK